VMAVDTLLNALVREGRVTVGAAAGIRAQLNLAYDAVRSRRAYNPVRFRAALGAGRRSDRDAALMRWRVATGWVSAAALALGGCGGGGSGGGGGGGTPGPRTGSGPGAGRSLRRSRAGIACGRRRAADPLPRRSARPRRATCRRSSR
jgi:hypothetical protein